MQTTKKTPRNSLIGRAIALVVVFGIIASLTIVHTGRLFGHTFKHQGSEAQADTVETLGDGREVINTTDLGKDITGYAGPVPLEIYLTDGHIDSIVALPNAESPGFFSRLEKNGLTAAWNGLTPAEAASLEVDAVTGATYSSRAYIENVRRGMTFAMGNAQKRSSQPVTAPMVAALIVVLCGAVIPLFTTSHIYRTVQQLFNVGVLGFWAGTFVDYALMMNFAGNTPVMSIAFVTTIALLATGFIYPLFGRPNHYCSWICPFGSLQDLAGAVPVAKWRLSAKTVRALDNFRQALWVVLLVCLYAGWATAWIDNEIFTAFIVESASWTVMAVGIAFVLLSLFVKRPFCRFVCPTGSILKNA